MNSCFLFVLKISTLSLLTAVAIHAETVTVSDADSLMRLFESADEKSMGTNVVLEDDIDFANTVVVPFGINNTGDCIAYRGVLQGKGHTLKRLIINQDGNAKNQHAGLFCGIDGATIEDLVFDTSCSMTGTDSGALAVVVTGSAILRNVTSHSTVSGNGTVGGLFARIEPSTSSFIEFEGCVVEGNVSNNGDYTGGFIGTINHNDIRIKFMNSENGCTVNSFGYEGRVGGLIGFIGNNKNVDVKVENCTNRGSFDVRSSAKNDIFVGGIIGFIFSSRNIFITMNNVTTAGTITTEKTSFSTYAGGLLGATNDTSSLNMNITQTISKVELRLTQSGGYGVYGGGLIGVINLNRDFYGFFSDILSASKVTLDVVTQYGYTSGFIGRFSYNPNSALIIKWSVNNGTFSMEKPFAGEFYTGGFIGEVHNNEHSQVIANDATNNANGKLLTTNIWSRICGLIGNVAAEQGHDFTLKVINSANYGDLSCEGGKSSGLYWTNEKNCEGVKSYVNNCVNKGDLTGVQTNGLVNIATMVRNAVMMGALNETNCERIGNGETATSYTLKGICIESFSGNLEFKQDSDGFYYTTTNHIRLDEELNKVSTDYQYGMLWDPQLNLFDAFRVHFGSPIEKDAYVQPKNTFNNACTIIKTEIDKYIAVDRASWDVIVNEMVIEKDLDVALCFNLTMGGVENKTILVEYGTTFSEIEELKKYLNESYAIIDSNDNTTMYDKQKEMKQHMLVIIVQKVLVSIGRPKNKRVYVINGTTLDKVASTLDITFDGFRLVDRNTWTEIENTTPVETNIDIALCHKLVLNGALNTTMLIEHDTLFLEVKALKPFMNKTYAVLDSNDKHIIYKENTVVDQDMNVQIKRVNVIETEFEFDGNSEDVDLDQVKKDIEDLMKDNDSVIMDIIVKENENSHLVILVAVVEDDTHDAAGALISCSKYK